MEEGSPRCSPLVSWDINWIHNNIIYIQRYSELIYVSINDAPIIYTDDRDKSIK